MSDGLIERLERYTGGGPKCGTWVTLEDLKSILSALKTVRGIEAAKRILIEWDEEVKIWRINTYTSEGWQSGKTLAAAVEAAGKKQ